MRIKNILKKILPASFSKIDATKAEIISAINSYNVENTIQNTRGGAYSIQGKNNSIVIVEEDGHERELTENGRIKGLEIVINGSGNTIKIKKTARFDKCYFDITSSFSEISIGSFEWGINNLYVSCTGQNCKLNIEDGIFISSAKIFLGENKSSIYINKDLMCSMDVVLFTTDAHTIVDNNSKKRINNMTKPILIGSHVWLGYGVFIGKNVTISDNTVVGAKSVVTNEFSESNVVIAGNPAKIIKRNINWDKKLYE